jgi:hypothetical protein
MPAGNPVAQGLATKGSVRQPAGRSPERGIEQMDEDHVLLAVNIEVGENVLIDGVVVPFVVRGQLIVSAPL